MYADGDGTVFGSRDDGEQDKEPRMLICVVLTLNAERFRWNELSGPESPLVVNVVGVQLLIECPLGGRHCHRD